MGSGTRRASYVLKHRPRSASVFDCMEDRRYGLLLSNGGLVFTCLVGTMIRIYDAIRMSNAATKPWPARSSPSRAEHRACAIVCKGQTKRRKQGH